jgi:methylmalonyl-CoA/ethylmalonyl-CoA epimerase
MMQRTFSPVMQNAFVVDDLEAALDHWVNKMGVGPFYVFSHIQFQEIYFRGGSGRDIDMTAAIGYWGDIQIEFIQQHNDAPSIYSEFRAKRGTGMQHMGVLTGDLDAELKRLAPLGIVPVQWGSMPTGMRFAYVSSDHHPGAMLEIIEPGPIVTDYFKMMKEAADRWDGTNGVIRT